MTNQPREEVEYTKIYPDLNVHTNLHITNELSLTGPPPPTKCATPVFATEYTHHSVNFTNIDYNADSYDLAFLAEYGIKMPVSLFELIIDRLEKEWYFFKHTLVKNTFIPFESSAGVCNVCSYSSVRTGNNLVYCDGCNLCVHQECYGVPIIPHGSWFCKPCLYQLGPLYCRFCVKTGGAYKMTSTMKWGHVVCVMWNKDLYFGNEVFMEPIEDPNRTNAHRLKHSCSICASTKGVHIRCAYTECETRYHVTCAIENDLYMDQNNMLTYCIVHDPRRDIRYDDDFEYYPVIGKVPRIRRPVKLAQPQKSLLLQVKNMRPFACTYLMDRLYCNDLCNFLVEKDVLACVMKYWCKKTRVLNLGPLIPYLCFDVNGGIGWDWYEKRGLFCYGQGADHGTTGSDGIKNDDCEDGVGNGDATSSSKNSKGTVTADCENLNMKIVHSEERSSRETNTIDPFKHVSACNVYSPSAHEQKKRKLSVAHESSTSGDPHQETKKRVKGDEQLNTAVALNNPTTSVFKKGDDTTLSPCYSGEQRAEYQKWLESVKEGCMHRKMSKPSRDDVLYMYAPLYDLKRVIKALIEHSEVRLELIRTNREIYEIMYDRKRYVLKNVMGVLDREEYVLFKDPVTEDIAPNYFSVISEPMDFEGVYRKIGQYDSVHRFFDDLRLIGTNCATYNEHVPYFVTLANKFLREVEQLEQHALQMLDENVECENGSATNGLL
ncbi:hypothetical protein VCUG_00415 [Vavraia culicis subsp. floridensis]|uniref:PHD-type domain-containing protein n=1 Tax=Vavraia culicis (isolate floridensis) TaxID=948595 RepID=L2GXT1_VAVCU|nr:uncharacterized protein VCUG_00415 [Vavraia culicis subsp. floridensis]ELA48177.1 hypothetical protein VCUG_00415 [Vavraia culicis subsp. floridensis]